MIKTNNHNNDNQRTIKKTAFLKREMVCHQLKRKGKAFTSADQPDVGPVNDFRFLNFVFEIAIR